MWASAWQCVQMLPRYSFTSKENVKSLSQYAQQTPYYSSTANMDSVAPLVVNSWSSIAHLNEDVVFHWVGQTIWLGARTQGKVVWWCVGWWEGKGVSLVDGPGNLKTGRRYGTDEFRGIKVSLCEHLNWESTKLDLLFLNLSRKNCKREV